MERHLNGEVGSTLDEAIARVIEAFDGIVRPEGGSVSFLALDGPTLRVAYLAGTNEACPTCVMEPDALGQMMLDMLRDQAPEVEAVEVAVVEPGSSAVAGVEAGREV